MPEVLLKYSNYMKTSAEQDKIVQPVNQTEIREKEVERQQQELKLREDLEAKQQAAATEKFKSIEGEFKVALQAFKRYHLSFTDTVSAASDRDKRKELKRLEDDFKALKVLLLTLGSADQLRKILLNIKTVLWMQKLLSLQYKNCSYIN